MEESYEEEESFVSLPLATDESLPICSDENSVKHDDTLSIAPSSDGDIFCCTSAETGMIVPAPFASSTPIKLPKPACDKAEKRKRKKLPVTTVPATVSHDHLDNSDSASRSFSHSSSSIMGNLTMSDQSSELNVITGVEAGKRDWKLSSVLELDGCGKNCAIAEHMLNEHSILSAHSQFYNKSLQEQNAWVIEYFNSHCPPLMSME